MTGGPPSTLLAEKSDDAAFADRELGDAETLAGATVLPTASGGQGPMTARQTIPSRGAVALERSRRYRVLRRLGSGGMGIVYAAHDLELDREIAIKLLRHDASEEARARLQREARAMAKLSHPNVIAVFDVGTVGDDVFVAMELVDGCTLRE
jgi:eukaryotic-like serine/threonine-protein kinase